MIDLRRKPHTLRVGAVAGGFEVEGGYNGVGEPSNNWCWWEAEGRAQRSADRLPWRRLERQVAAAAEAGGDTIRVSIEWARCEPFDGEIDRRAVGAYCRLLDCCHDHGLQPVVTLHRLAHPAWMGVDLWLRPDAPERFRRWVETALDRFAGRAHQWVTVDQLNTNALWSYLSGRNPPGRKLAIGATVRSLDHLLAAHVLAYEAIKERQPQAVVAVGQAALPVYELDGLLLDLLLARSHGVDRHDLQPWLIERREAFHSRATMAEDTLAWVVRQWARASIPLNQALARTVAAVYQSPCARPMDAVQVTTDPVDLRQLLPLRLPVGRGAEPGPVAAALRLHHEPGLPLWMVSESPVGVDQFRLNLSSAVEAIDTGVPVAGCYQRLDERADPAGAEAYRGVVDGLRPQVTRIGRTPPAPAYPA